MVVPGPAASGVLWTTCPSRPWSPSLIHTEYMNAEGGLERRTRDELVPSEFDFEQHVSTLSLGLQSSARSADVLLLPATFGDEHPGGFPELTPDVFGYLREHLPEGVTVEAAVDEEDYAEYSFWSSIEIILPVLLVADLTTIDVVTSLLVAYVKNLLTRERLKDGHVRSNIHVVVSPDGSIALNHAYEGPADTFERAMADLSRHIENRQGTTENREDPCA